MTGTVLFDLTAALAGGQRTRAREFLRRLRHHDRHSRIVVLAPESFGLRPADDVEHVVTPSISGPLGAVERMARQSLQVAQLVRARRIESYVTFSHFLPPTVGRGVRTVIGVSNLAPFDADAIAAESSVLGRARLHVLARTIVGSCRRATKVIALSDACRSILVQRGIEPEKVAVIPNGVEHPSDDELREARSLHLPRLACLDGTFVAYVSHFYPYKNFERLIAGYGQLPAALRRDWPLLLVGDPHDAGYHARVRSAATALGDEVCFLDRVSAVELRAVYARSSLFAFPSLIENCPNVLLEALAHRCAIVTGNNAPMPEFAGPAANYFDPRSIGAIAEVLEASMNAPKERSRLSHEASARARRYSWDEFTRSVVALYRA